MTPIISEAVLFDIHIKSPPGRARDATGNYISPILDKWNNKNINIYVYIDVICERWHWY